MTISYFLLPAGTMNVPFEPQESSHVEKQLNGSHCDGERSETPTSHSDLIQTAVHAITANQENVFRGVQDVVQDHDRKKLNKRTNMLIVQNIIVCAIVSFGWLILNQVFPNTKTSLTESCMSVFLVFLSLFMHLYERFGKSHRIINLRLRNAARYIDVCQVSEEFTKLMLPNFSPEVQDVCHCQLVGSSEDSFGFFPSFSANVFRCRIHPLPFTQDVDMNLFYDALVLTEQNLVDIGQPGFCWVQVDQGELLTGTGDSFIQDCLVQHWQIPGRSYLSGKLVSEKIGSFIPTNRGNVIYNYPAVTYKTDIQGPQGRFGFDMDVVFGIKLSVWPQEARSWQDRVRGILPVDIIKDVQALGCYIVYKHCSGSKFNMDHQSHDLDWRITFAEAESLLFKHHASKEALKLCYVIVKFVLKNHIKTSKKSFPALKSYHLKAVFLWLAEEGHSTYDLVDVKNNANLANLFHLVFERYQEVLEKGELPHYFMPSVNIIASCSQEELSAGVDVLKQLRRQPICNIEVFGYALINKNMFAILAASLLITGLIFVGLAIAFGLDSTSDDRFLEIVGGNHTDLFKYDCCTRSEFITCLTDRYLDRFIIRSIVDIQPAINYCLGKLQLT